MADQDIVCMVEGNIAYSVVTHTAGVTHTVVHHTNMDQVMQLLRVMLEMCAITITICGTR